jgi:aspartate carbamoyltransferase catalytic subunit
MFATDIKRSHLTVVLLGDLSHGRTVHSLAKLLCTSNIWGNSLLLRYCAPEGLEMPDYIQQYCSQHENVQQETVRHLREAFDGADVLYVTRIQRERFESTEEYEKVRGTYIVDAALMKTAPADMVVLHPLPRVDEISTEVDADPRAAYFRQMENGMFVRMALLSLILGV